MSLYTIPCVLFAGGKSSRMGEDKALLPFGEEQSLVQYQYERLEEIFARVYISAKESAPFEHFDAVVIEDIIAKDVYAPTAGLVNMFRQLKAEGSIFVLSVDTPFVDKEIIAKFLEAQGKEFDAIIVRTAKGIHPLCGIYTRALEDKLVNMLEEGKHKLSDLLEDANVYYIDIDDEDALLNLNTPQEYERALQLLKERV